MAAKANTPGLQPLTGLPSFRVVAQPYGTPTEVHGGGVHQKHSDPGEQASPYPWEEFAGPHGPWGPSEDEMLSDLPESRTFAAGKLSDDPSADLTPYRTHAGPHIRGTRMDRGPDGNADVLYQSYQAHGTDTGAQRKAIAAADPLQDHWERFYESVPGDDILPPVPGAVSGQAGGFGSNDHRNNAYAKVNPYGLANSHRMRRYATGSIPGNYQWMKPGGRPLSKTMAGPARPATGMGPFQGDDIGQSFGLQGAVLLDPATEYVAPPQVNVVPATQQYAVPDPIELW